ncbi:MAG: hypothetical protein A3J24_00585 [Deltaproteobacteria bacterium RIFCSPLOWO2_02_FULL_53_8]|nr:MAG: hypothetical protein A3J24_00585 [Deltaproteobacteria bacterium RIFCSPLOWO2_02_FULL_53_8]
MRTLIAVALVLCSWVARADALYCPGKIAQLIVYGTGQLSIVGTWRGDWTHLCNLNTGSPIDSVTCSHWSSMATMAFKEGAQVGVYYNVPVGTTCANLATYANSPTPVYFRLNAPQ